MAYNFDKSKANLGEDLGEDRFMKVFLKKLLFMIVGPAKTWECRCEFYSYNQEVKHGEWQQAIHFKLILIWTWSVC